MSVQSQAILSQMAPPAPAVQQFQDLQQRLNQIQAGQNIQPTVPYMQDQNAALNNLRQQLGKKF
jgi:hypothetical protein